MSDNLILVNGNKRPYRILISSPQGRSGKTIVTIGICRLLREKGYSIQPFKKGPDFIDPSWLTLASGRQCRNLDLFLIQRERLIQIFMEACREVDFAIIEGAMGLYDGLSIEETTAELAYIFDIPILMVINTSRMAESISAMILGYKNFRKDIKISGVILNRVSGVRHETKLRNSVEKYCQIPVIGSVPKDIDINIQERHLGLIPSREKEGAEDIVNIIADKLRHCIDLKAILDIANKNNKIIIKKDPEVIESSSFRDSRGVKENKCLRVKIGVIYDKVFNFYYPENFEALQREGAELIFINSLKDRLPPIDGLYIGGGFPEFFLKELESNVLLKEDIANAIKSGFPVYAECGGLMYLCKKIDWKGESYDMVGVIPAMVQISERPEGHGYVIADVDGENPFFQKGLTITGHEFHHSKIYFEDEVKLIFKINRGKGIDGKRDGILYKNLLGTYMHIHALGTPCWAEAFVLLAAKERKFRRR